MSQENMKREEFMSRYKAWKDSKTKTDKKPLQDKSNHKPTWTFSKPTDVVQKRKPEAAPIGPPPSKARKQDITTRNVTRTSNITNTNFNRTSNTNRTSNFNRTSDINRNSVRITAAKLQRTLDSKEKKNGNTTSVVRQTAAKLQRDINRASTKTVTINPAVVRTNKFQDQHTVKDRVAYWRNKQKTDTTSTISTTKPRTHNSAPSTVTKPAANQKPAVTRPLPGAASRRHTTTLTRRRLSAGTSRKGILKRRSCVSSTAAAADTALVPTPAQVLKTGESTVKFATPTCTSTMKMNSTYRKTPGQQERKQFSHHKHETMRHELNCWLESKGKTPTKFRHLMCFDASMADRKKSDSQLTRSITVEQLSKQQAKMADEESVCQNLLSKFAESKTTTTSSKSIACQLDEMLKECHSLVDSGCPADTIVPWLDSIYEHLPLARFYTPYYRCKVEAIKTQRTPTDVIDVISQAILNQAQPSSELAELTASVMEHMISQSSAPAIVMDTAVETCESAVAMEMQGTDELEENNIEIRKEIEESNTENSTEAPFTVQFSVTNITPFKKKRAPSLCSPFPSQKVVTPVRRSTRRSIVNNITDSEKVVRSISDLSETEKSSALFRPNHALDDVIETYQ